MPWLISPNAVSKQEGAILNLKIVNRQQDFMEVLVMSMCGTSASCPR